MVDNPSGHAVQSTVECRYNVVQFITIIFLALQRQDENLN